MALETFECPGCGAEAERLSRGAERTFCTPGCRDRFHARAKAEGAALVLWAKVWALHNGRGEDGRHAFAELSRIARLLNTRDREAGRPDPTPVARRQRASGIRFGDRGIS